MSAEKKPLISVVMSVYNGESFLREAIDSILAQTYENFEFLILNNVSTDRSRDIILSYGDPRIKLIDNAEKICLAGSLNKGLKLAEGKYIARMDADDISMPDRLRTQFEYMEENPHIGLVGSYYLIIDEEGKPINELAQNNLPLNHNELVKNHFTTHYVGHGTFFFRKFILDYTGTYDEDFKTTEDMDFLLRVSEKFEIANIPKALYSWRKNKENVSRKTDLIEKYKYLAISKALLRKAEMVSETMLHYGIFEKMLAGYYRLTAEYLRRKYHLNEL